MQTVEEAAEVLRSGRRVRITGGGTKLQWGKVVAEPEPEPEPEVELSTLGFDRIVEHSPRDLVAVVQAGVPLAVAQAVFASSGQMLALDPPLGLDGRATVGGVVATADSGPLRHRYGGPRDLVIGATVVLSDGTVARTGGKVIKNVAGYDLAKLYAGSFGTIGLLVEVALRLHPLPASRVTVVGVSGDPAALAAGASAIAHGPLEVECLDVAWREGSGAVLVRVAGAAPAPRAEGAARVLAAAGLEAHVVDEADEAGDEVWARQREGQRSTDGVIVKVSAVPAGTEALLRAAEEMGGSVVGRAGLGLFWFSVPPSTGAEDISRLRGRLHPWPAVVLDAPLALRQAIDVWGDGEVGDTTRRLVKAVKQRFDPAGALVGAL